MVKRTQSDDAPQADGAPSAYAGDVTPGQAWDKLSEDPAAVLVDVRTRAEWMFVGIPDLSDLTKEPVLIEWQSLPSMALNPAFAEQFTERMEQIGAGFDAPVFFLCRSGARSQSAAMACTAAGYKACYNVVGGFEGDLDPHGHRGAVSGWKCHGLAWRQK